MMQDLATTEATAADDSVILLLRLLRQSVSLRRFHLWHLAAPFTFDISDSIDGQPLFRAPLAAFGLNRSIQAWTSRYVASALDIVTLLLEQLPNTLVAKVDAQSGPNSHVQAQQQLAICFAALASFLGRCTPSSLQSLIAAELPCRLDKTKRPCKLHMWLAMKHVTLCGCHFDAKAKPRLFIRCVCKNPLPSRRLYEHSPSVALEKVECVPGGSSHNICFRLDQREKW
jgi:hypothetical protein